MSPSCSINCFLLYLRNVKNEQTFSNSSSVSATCFAICSFRSGHIVKGCYIIVDPLAQEPFPFPAKSTKRAILGVWYNCFIIFCFLTTGFPGKQTKDNKTPCLFFICCSGCYLNRCLLCRWIYDWNWRAKRVFCTGFQLPLLPGIACFPLIFHYLVPLYYL